MKQGSFNVNTGMKANGQKLNETKCLWQLPVYNNNNNNNNCNNLHGWIIIYGEVEESKYCWISSPLFLFVANEDNIRF